MLPLCLAALMVASSRCEFLLSDEELDKQCDANRMAPGADVTVKMTLYIYENTDLADTNYSIYNALQVEINGWIRRLDCRGEEISYKTIKFTEYTSEKKYLKGYPFCTLPDYYTSVSNWMEFFSVSVTMTAVFKDGRIYESSPYEIVSYRLKDDSNYKTNQLMTLRIENWVKWTRKI